MVHGVQFPDLFKGIEFNREKFIDHLAEEGRSDDSLKGMKQRISDSMKKAIEEGSHVDQFKMLASYMSGIYSLEFLFGKHIQWISENEKWFIFDDFLSLSVEDAQKAYAAAMASALSIKNQELIEKIVGMVKEKVGNFGRFQVLFNAALKGIAGFENAS